MKVIAYMKMLFHGIMLSCTGELSSFLGTTNLKIREYYIPKEDKSITFWVENNHTYVCLNNPVLLH